VPTHHVNHSCCYLQQEVHLQAIPTERTQAVANKSVLVYTYKSNLHKVSEFKLKVDNWPYSGCQTQETWYKKNLILTHHRDTRNEAEAATHFPMTSSSGAWFQTHPN
jgi:hypothetical protein